MGSACFRPKPKAAPLLPCEDIELATAEERQVITQHGKPTAAVPTGPSDEEQRHFALHYLLCTDSVQSLMWMKNKTLARPCATQKHGLNGSVSFDLLCTFVGQDFTQTELDALGEDTLFVDALFAHTGLDTYRHKHLRLYTVPNKPESILYDVRCLCECDADE